MKEISKITVLLFIVISIVSCSENNYTVENFKTDKRLSLLVEEFESVVKMDPNELDIPSIIVSQNKLHTISQELVNDYGLEEIENYFMLLKSDEKVLKANKCCKRNTNGTTNWNCCGWWGTVVASFYSGINCKTPSQSGGPDAINPGLNDFEQYYDCVQEQICTNC